MLYARVYPQDNHTIHVSRSNKKVQETWRATSEGVKGATADFACFHCPLVAPAGAKPLPHNRTIKIKIKFPIAEANLLELLKTHLSFSAISFATRRAS